MRTIVHALLAAALLVFPVAGYAQVGFSVAGGMSMPTGDYGEYSGDGLATIGFTALGNVAYTIPAAENLAWTGSAGFSTHGVRSDFSDALVGIGGTNVQVGRFWVVPLLTGLRYDIPIGDAASAYGTGQLGVVFVKGPTIKVSGQQFTYDLAAKLGYAFGVGIQVNPTFGIGLRYVPVGEIDTELDAAIGDGLDVRQTVSYLDVFVSVRLR